MKKFHLYITILLSGSLAFAQTPPQSITKPEGQQTEYIIDANSGQTTLEATDFVFFKNHTFIKSGADFLARAVGDVPIPYASVSFSDENYVLTRTYQRAMPSFAPVDENDVLEQITYFDGLGRPMQQVAIKASQDPNDNITDIVSHIGYDSYGRAEKEWLPYRADGGLGSFRTDAEDKTDDYYELNYADDIDPSAPNPFSQKEFEPSPLNRVLKQAAPGEDWEMGSGHEIRFDYQTNHATEVPLFNVTTTFANGIYEPTLQPSTSNYGAGELYKNVTKDENWSIGNDHTVEEFTDKRGRVLLKRTYNNGSAHNTFYMYDDYGNLSFVVPPKVTVANGISATELDQLCYQYRYDHRNRLAEKKLPGKGSANDWESIVYDKLDRPIMTQDPNLKAQGKWLFTKYDAFGRVAYTGLATGGTRAGEQTAADGHGTQWANPTGTTTIDGLTVHYDGGGYPAISAVTELHTVNYYDGYDFARDGIAKPSGAILGQTQADDVRGLPTVGKVRVLTTADWITTLTAYDTKRRAIFTQSENDYLSTVDIVQTELDQAGKAIKTETSHQKGTDPAIVTVDNFEYDHAARLKRQEQELDGHTEMLAHNGYDGIGQLVSKEVGNTEEDPLQTVDYAYNIRGWLKTINEDANNDNDLFDFTIKYNDPTSGTALFNGNISQTIWATASSNNTSNPVSTQYTYSYDALNRIIGAKDNTDNYNLGVYDGSGNLTGPVTYDKNGNIQTLQRKGVGGTIDNLDYDYLNGEASNRLAKVADASGNTEGFANGSNTGDDYTYDANGNMTTDSNKEIQSIAYNHLNLPTVITQSNLGVNNTIDYIYAADGTKLKKTARDYSNGSGGTPVVTDYAGNYVYEGGNLRQFSHSEGYVEVNGTGDYDYVYAYKDHLGTMRLTYSDFNGNGSIDPGTEIVQERNYYPFGLTHKGYKSVVNGTESNFKTFQSRELHNDLDLRWIGFKYRIHDPAIGRFIQVDPVADKYEYNGVYNFSENRVIDGIDLEGLEYVTVRHYMLGDKEMMRHNTLYYTQTNDEINSVGGTTRGIYRAASSGPEGTSGVKHEYIDINTGKQVQDPVWEIRQNTIASSIQYHGLYSGGGSITDGNGNYDFSFQPIDWNDAIAKRHDQDYFNATNGYDNYTGYIEDIRTYQADVDMVDRLNTYKGQRLNPFKEVNLPGVETPFRTSWSWESGDASDGQLFVISALRDYKAWKIDNNYGSQDTFSTIGGQLKDDDLGLWAIIYILNIARNSSSE